MSPLECGSLLPLSVLDPTLSGSLLPPWSFYILGAGEKPCTHKVEQRQPTLWVQASSLQERQLAAALEIYACRKWIVRPEPPDRP